MRCFVRSSWFLVLFVFQCDVCEAVGGSGLFDAVVDRRCPGRACESSHSNFTAKNAMHAKNIAKDIPFRPRAPIETFKPRKQRNREWAMRCVGSNLVVKLWCEIWVGE